MIQHRCVQCNQPVGDGALLCQSCQLGVGAHVPASDRAVSLNNPPALPVYHVRRNFVKPILIVGAAILIIGVAAFFTVNTVESRDYNAHESAEEHAQRLAEAKQDRDESQAQFEAAAAREHQAFQAETRKNALQATRLQNDLRRVQQSLAQEQQVSNQQEAPMRNASNRIMQAEMDAIEAEGNWQLNLQIFHGVGGKDAVDRLGNDIQIIRENLPYTFPSDQSRVQSELENLSRKQTAMIAKSTGTMFGNSGGIAGMGTIK